MRLYDQNTVIKLRLYFLGGLDLRGLLGHLRHRRMKMLHFVSKTALQITYSTLHSSSNWPYSLGAAWNLAPCVTDYQTNLDDLAITNLLNVGLEFGQRSLDELLLRVRNVPKREDLGHTLGLLKASVQIGHRAIFSHVLQAQHAPRNRQCPGRAHP